jgi:hypothetical protein
MRATICGVLALASGMALPLAGQVERGRTRVEMVHPRVVRLPYTAEYKTTTVKTLADGTTITHESSEVVAFDSQGRRMTATTTIPLSADQTPLTHVSVFDPVAHTRTNWTVPGQKVTVNAMPTPGAARPSCAASTSAATPAFIGSIFGVDRTQPYRPNVEDLGTETIQGVEARGRRTITTIPAGKIGNNAPIQRTTETWTAINPGLPGLLVRQVSDDPQAGKTNQELVNFTQAEPDAAVFQPPADYEVVNKEPPTPACPGTATSSPSTASTGQSFAPIPEPPPPPEQ